MFLIRFCVPAVLMLAAANPSAALSAPEYLNPTGPGEYALDQYPILATDHAGTWLAVWTYAELSTGMSGTDRDLAFSRSDDDGATWSSIAFLNTNATSDSGFDDSPSIATDGAGNWIAVWASTENLSGTDDDNYSTLYARSSDNGATWSAPALMNPGTETDWIREELPQVASDGNGRWITLWTFYEQTSSVDDDDIFIARSDDNGATWTTPAALSSYFDSDSPDDRDVYLATDGAGNWIAAWSRDYDAVSSRSTDNGVTWSAPIVVDANPLLVQEIVSGVVTDGAGNWLVTRWILGDVGSPIGTDQDIACSRSTNNGATWSAPVLINSTATTDSGSDADASIAVDDAGNWVALWRSTENLGGLAGTDADIFMATSTDAGASWSATAVLTPQSNTDTGYDIAPAVVTDSDGRWLVVWQSNENLGGTIGTDPDIFISRSTNDGLTWSAPGPLVTPQFADSDRDHDPSLATDDQGTWVAAWPIGREVQGSQNPVYDIAVARTVDNGATWSSPEYLNPAAPAAAYDGFTSVATDKQGTWVVVWESYDDFGGTAGTDTDIAFSRSVDNGATWTVPALLNSNATTDGSSYDMRPVVAADAAGNWIAAWPSAGTLTGGGWDIAYARSADGQTWSGPQILNTIGLDAERQDGPISIATDDNGVWIAAFASAYEADGFLNTYQIFIAKSIDAGATWSTPQQISSPIGSSYLPDYYTPSVATDSRGSWIVVWAGEIDPDGEFDLPGEAYYSRSTDGGTTWSASNFFVAPGVASVYSSATPHVDSDAHGSWFAVWGSDEHDGLVYARSFDAGATWLGPTPLVSEPDPMPGGVDYEPSLCIDASGRTIVLWEWSRTDYSVQDADMLVMVAPPLPLRTRVILPPVALLMFVFALRRLRARA